VGLAAKDRSAGDRPSTADQPVPQIGPAPVAVRPSTEEVVATDEVHRVKTVSAWATEQPIAPSVGRDPRRLIERIVDNVSTRPASKQVITTTTHDNVSARSTEDTVGAVLSPQHVVRTVADEHVVLGRTFDTLDSDQAITSFTADNTRLQVRHN
jgi:hypothetical protein